MPILSTNTNNLTFDSGNQQWIVEAGVVIAAPADSLGAVGIPYAGDYLLNNGSISALGGGIYGQGAVAVANGADGTLVVNNATGSIVGLVGVSANAANVSVSNAGSIIGFATFGVEFGQVVAPEVGNSGYIHGKTAAIKGNDIDGLTLTNSGVIDSDGDAMSLLLRGHARIDNTGTISGNDSAILALGFGATVEVVNQGVIRGDVVLSNGADIYNGRGGVMDGVVFGGNGDDALTGGGDNNTLQGDGGQDTISGRGGDDILIGGALGDTLKGRSGADDFVYSDMMDSQGGSDATRDIILDFNDSENDRIDFRPLDAKIGNGNQKFTFIGIEAFTGKKGELRYVVDGGDAIVQADVTGDGEADMTIKLNDVSKLVAGDFYL